MARRRVVVTGLGILSPLGNTREESWNAVKNAESGIARITRFDIEDFSSQIAGEVKNFDPLAFVDRKELKKLDLFSQYAIAASQDAWDHAGLSEGSSLERPRCGSIFGIGIGGLGTLEKYHQAYLEGGPRKISPFLIPAMIPNLAPGNVAIRYGLQGVNYSITSACTSSTHALGESYRLIANDLQDLMVVGGTESVVTPIGMGGFCALKALSTNNENPTGASRPFDKDRDGFVLSEGSAVLILESLEHAEKRGATVYAEVLGYGFSCDAFHITAPSEDGSGAMLSMENALQDAGLTPTDIQYVNAHGTSTMADVIETMAIKKVFGDYAKNGLLVSSTKSMTGHLLGAAGAIEACLSVLALHDGVVPPTINLDNPDEGCDLDYVPHTARKVQVDRVISNSFGFGGTNATIVLGVYKG